MRNVIFILSIVSSTVWLAAQTDPFQIHLEPISIKDLPGLQAYAWGQHAGKWLIVGGRLDGLHRRQPWASFDPEGRNIQLIVVDPELEKIWTAPLTSLSTPLQDQLSSTNMEFHQDGNFLYLIGGYGHSETVGSKVTFAMLTVMDVPGTIAAVQNKGNISGQIRFITDTNFAVTGGHLNKIYDTYYLVGGQKFNGNYNPMNHATFTQEYTNGIRKFNLEDDGNKLTVTHLPGITDTAAFHRRDYNVGAQIMADSVQGLMSFSGPFQLNADLPFLNVVSIDSHSYHIVPEFAQYYNNYHCAVMPLYASSANEMHTVFFGGIAQYYSVNGNLVQDTDVPFVKTIARVTRHQNGQMAEYKLPVEMPGYLGASAEFIPLPEIPRYANGVIKLDELDATSAFVGYIYGGIESSAANIFWINDGTESEAHPTIYKVYVNKNEVTGLHAINSQSNNGMQMQIYPNPNEGFFNIIFFLQQQVPVMLSITDASGKTVLREDLTDKVKTGMNHIEKYFKPFTVGGLYLVTVTAGGVAASQQILVKE